MTRATTMAWKIACATEAQDFDTTVALHRAVGSAIAVTIGDDGDVILGISPPGGNAVAATLSRDALADLRAALDSAACAGFAHACAGRSARR